MLDHARRILSLSRHRAKEGHLSISRQLLEMAVLLPFHGVGPTYYHMAGFWRRDLGWNEKTSHLSASEYRRALERLNPRPYRKISQNKISEKAILELFNIPTPRFLGVLSPTVGLDRTGHPLRSAGELAVLLQSNGVSRLVFKYPEGYGGKDVHVVEFLPSGEFRDCCTGHTYRLEHYCEAVLGLGEKHGWLLEKYFEQHELLARLNPSSVNTVRLWVLLTESGHAEVLIGYLRMGRTGSVVDNVSSGGLVAPIDLDSGQLRAGQDPHAAREHYPNHPDTGSPIEGLLVPYWQDLQALAKKAIALFPEMRFAGVDMAIGPSGPAIIELNVVPDREGAGRLDGLVFRMLLR